MENRVSGKMFEIFGVKCFSPTRLGSASGLVKWQTVLLTCLLMIFELSESSAYSTSLNERDSTERRGHHHQNPGFQCPADIKACIEPVTSKVCSSKGACVCGQCACFQTDFEKYYGRFCEHCDSCSPNLCDLLKPCVECRIHKTGQYSQFQDCEVNCSRFPEIQIAEIASSDEKVDNYFCAFNDSEGCEFYFIYGYDATGALVILAEREKECPVKSQKSMGAIDLSVSSSSPVVNSSSISYTNSIQDEDVPHQSHHRNKPSARKPPPLLVDYKQRPRAMEKSQHLQINDFDSSLPFEDSDQELDQGILGRTRGSNYKYNNNNNDNPSSKKLNTKAFDLMIVCGLSMSSRNSEATSQLPQYFQRNGIHFDVENCQFIPKSESFIFAPGINTDEEEAGQNAARETAVFNILTIYVSFLPALHYVLYHFLY